MNIEDLEKEYRRVYDLGSNFTEWLKLKKLLLSDNSFETCQYHYDLLKNRNNIALYHRLRACFMDRPNVEDFLLEKAETEKDEEMQADILHALGSINSPHAKTIAHEFLNHNNEYHREVASFVLGWVGGKEDIPLLREHMLNEENPHLRITAASAHRQIGWRLPELKNELLASLKEGFEKEKDDEVIAWIIVMIESIAVKRLGLREDKEEPDILHGDVQKAKVKTAKFLAELNL